MMLDNQTLIFRDDSGKITKYEGIICSSIEEASELLHPDYWKEIPVGSMYVMNNGTKLIHVYDNTMLIRVNGSRHFIQIGDTETENRD